MADDKDMAAVSDAAPNALRDEEGAVRSEFVAIVSEAVAGRDAALLRSLVGDLHESDTGDLIGALDHDLRPQLIALMGKDFDFAARHALGRKGVGIIAARLFGQQHGKALVARRVGIGAH